MEAALSQQNSPIASRPAKRCIIQEDATPVPWLVTAAPKHETGDWDAHAELRTNHTKNALAVDQPTGALLHDLDRRGLLDETLVIFATEFGRTPGAQRTDGRDHHIFGFSIWLAGGGIKRGVVHGATDEIGFHAVESPHYVTDVHATILKLLGLDSRKLELPGRKRLEIDHGNPIEAIIA